MKHLWSTKVLGRIRCNEKRRRENCFFNKTVALCCRDRREKKISSHFAKVRVITYYENFIVFRELRRCQQYRTFEGYFGHFDINNPRGGWWLGVCRFYMWGFVYSENVRGFDSLMSRMMSTLNYELNMYNNSNRSTLWKNRLVKFNY